MECSWRAGLRALLPCAVVHFMVLVPGTCYLLPGFLVPGTLIIYAELDWSGCQTRAG